jgi:signal transduction histidine kinase
MTRILKLRLAGFATAIFVLAVLIGWAAVTSRTEVIKLQERFSTGNLRNFEIADHIQSSILRLNNTLIRFEMENTGSALEDFKTSSTELKTWIDRQEPLLNSPKEQQLVRQIAAAYSRYLAVASQAVNNLSKDRAARLTHIEETYRSSLAVFELGYQLADAHRLVLQEFLQSSQKSVLVLQRLMFGFLFLLLASLIWLFATVFHEMITPLQRKLVESHAIIERQEKLASLGVLAAGVAHEIRNPLTAIKARLFIQRKAMPKGSREYDDSLVISDEINRLEQIVKDFLEFARPAEPKLTVLTPEPLLREAIQFMSPQLTKSSIKISLDSCVAVPFQGDPQQLKQVLINLIQNAAESIEKNGSIILSARNGANRLNGVNRPVVTLEVKDTGKGIPPEVQKRLFDPFFTTKETGTGLGLSISARILEKHGGALEFQTLVNRGTTFGIILPAQ